MQVHCVICLTSYPHFCHVLVVFPGWVGDICTSSFQPQVCRRTGDPNKLMYCKRCDGAYHCYCQQPPHKVSRQLNLQNVSRGPYLCPKHTRCHSCGSTVPGSGLSTRYLKLLL
ncbi:hypothetical protein GW17_00046432 [Ensete ventricosum]|nr:hypothetical protein GW17_00046432 [Ensete ventricosum]RZR99139.1 hypothetical protein BHM03_00028626 [Ensete ventricosum]